MDIRNRAYIDGRYVYAASGRTFHVVDEAVRIGSESMYSLAAVIWTKDINVAHRTARALRAGSVWVKRFDAGDMTTPFGGYKQSGFGREKLLHAMDKQTQLKTNWIQLD